MLSMVEHILMSNEELELKDKVMEALGYRRILLSNVGLEKGARATYQKLITETMQ